MGTIGNESTLVKVMAGADKPYPESTVIHIYVPLAHTTTTVSLKCDVYEILETGQKLGKFMESCQSVFNNGMIST